MDPLVVIYGSTGTGKSDVSFWCSAFFNKHTGAVWLMIDCM